MDGEGLPVAGAHVALLPDHPVGTVTGDDGAFALPGAEGELVVRCFGFKTWRRAVGRADRGRALEVSLISTIHTIVGLEVTAFRRPAREAEHSTPVSRVTGAALWGQRASLPVLAERLRATPEVSAIGRDEYNSAPAIRGLARFRTVLLLDGVRIQSDREIGPSAGFVDPAMLDAVEIVRGPGSVLYGSDAIGGVVSLRSYTSTVEERRSWIESGWSSANDGFRTSSGGTARWGDTKVSFSLAHTSSGDYRLPGSATPAALPSAKAVNSGFERSAGQASVSFGRLEYTAFYSLGSDIGRPAREDERFTVEREEHVIHAVRFGAAGSGGPTEARLYLHPSRWRATVEEPRGGGSIRRQVRNYDSDDWGALITRTLAPGPLSLILGGQVDARSGVDIVCIVRDYDAAGAPTSTRQDRWVTGAASGSAGVFSHAVLSTARSRAQAGFRIDRTWRQAAPGSGGRVVPSGQLGFSVNGPGASVWSVNLATAFREPTVTELFFTGRRPAGYIEGNPSLAPERSFQADAGVRAPAGGLVLSLNGYATRLQDYITPEVRATGAIDSLRYENASRATVYGAAFEARSRGSWKGLATRASIEAVRGRLDSGTPLLDLHGPRATVEVLHARGRVHSHLTWRGSLAHRRTGAGEIARAGYGVLDVGTSVGVGPASLGITLQNALDQEYYERGEPVSYPSPSRSLIMSLRISG